jgi:hypothetical protein
VLRQGSPEDVFGYNVSKVNAVLSSKGREMSLVVGCGQRGPEELDSGRGGENYFEEEL